MTSANSPMSPDSGLPPSAAEIIHPGTTHARTPARGPGLFIPPVDLQTACLLIITLMLGLYALHLGSELFLPLATALLAAAALQPVVRMLGRVGIPQPVGAGLVVVGLSIAVVMGANVLAGPAAEWLDRAPETLRHVERKIQSIQQPIERVAAATERVADIATLNSQDSARVAVQDQSLGGILFASAQSLLIGVALMFSLLYFLLASRDRFAERLSRFVPGASHRGVKSIFEEVETEVSQYLLTITLVNIGLGVVVGFALWVLKMPSPALWGVFVGVVNYVPYIGAFVSSIVLTAVALLSYEQTSRALLVPLVFLTITAIEAMLITPSLHARRRALSPIAVLIAVTLGSCLWGVPGAIIAAPLLGVGLIALGRGPTSAPRAA
jgi:predicted PurR-regulated permease PerM